MLGKPFLRLLRQSGPGLATREGGTFDTRQPILKSLPREGGSVSVNAARAMWSRVGCVSGAHGSQQPYSAGLAVGLSEVGGSAASLDDTSLAVAADENA